MQDTGLSLIIVFATACGQVTTNEPDALADGSGTDVATDGPLAPSCRGLAATCGPSGTSNCCGNSVVLGGTYARSYDVSGDGTYPSANYGATVSDFQLDTYEVTVGRFRQFVTAGQGIQTNPPVSGMYAHPRIAGSGWDPNWNSSLATDMSALIAAVKCQVTYQTWTDTPGNNENRPMNCITWYEAMAFCGWDGGFLPTESEWNYAATGGADQRAYPWSSPPGFLGIDSTRASYQCSGDGTAGCAVTDLIAVGTKPAGNGRWDQSDLAGNVWEWALDWFTSQYSQNPYVDCADLTPSTSRVIRGGDYGDVVAHMRTGDRYSGFAPGNRGPNVGVRCARKL